MNLKHQSLHMYNPSVSNWLQHQDILQLQKEAEKGNQHDELESSVYEK